MRDKTEIISFKVIANNKILKPLEKDVEEIWKLF